MLWTIIIKLYLLVLTRLMMCCSEDGKITAGFLADQTEFPYVVSIQEMRRFNSTEIYMHRCGGTIITQWFVFTAARCVSWQSRKEGGFHPRLAADFVVLTGARNVDLLEPGARFYPVDEIILDKGFREHNTLKGFWIGDMALLKLMELDNFSFIHTAVFPKEEGTEFQLNQFTYDLYHFCIHPGWVSTGRSRAAKDPSVMKFVRMKVLPDDQCDRIFCNSYPDSCGVYSTTELELICALPEYSWSPCFAVSGTPLVCDGRFFGMYISSRDSCGRLDLPQTFISVAAVHRFFRALNSSLLLNSSEVPKFSPFMLLSFVLSILNGS